MSDPIGTPENPVKVKFDIDLPVSDDLRYEDVATGKLRVIEDDFGNKFTYDEWGHKVPVFAPGTSKTTRGEGFISYEGIPEIGVPGDDVEGEYDLRLDLGNGQFEEYDLEGGQSLNSLLSEAFSELGYNEAFISWLKGQYKAYTFVDDRTIDVKAALAAYNAFLIKSPMYEDEYFAAERGGREPVEQAYGIDYRMFRDAMVDAIQSAKGGGIATEQARLEEEKKQTAYLEQIAAAKAKEAGFAGENILQYIQRILQAGAPVSGERSIEDFMTRILPKINLIGQAAVTGASLVQNYQRAGDLQARANQAFLAEDYNAYDRLELQAYRMGNRVTSDLTRLGTNIERYTPELAQKSYLALIKEPTAYAKKAPVKKYKTYKTSAVSMPKATAKAIADKQSAKIKALEAKIADLTASFKKLKGQA